MGLDITCPKSKHGYHRSYGALHELRKAAYMLCGGPSDDTGFLKTEDFNWWHVLAAGRFPNLILHSDCQGTYTMKGRVGYESEDLLTGSLPGLLSELKELRKYVYQPGSRLFGRVDLATLNDFLAVVRDAHRFKSVVYFS